MSPIPSLAPLPGRCQGTITGSLMQCGNACSAVKCGTCSHALALCPECGGVDTVADMMRAHESTHEIAAGAKHVTCRWCDWTSADAYHPGDEYAKERAYEQQRWHVRTSHPRVFKQIAAYAANSRAR